MKTFLYSKLENKEISRSFSDKSMKIEYRFSLKNKVSFMCFLISNLASRIFEYKAVKNFDQFIPLKDRKKQL